MSDRDLCASIKESCEKSSLGSILLELDDVSPSCTAPVRPNVMEESLRGLSCSGRGRVRHWWDRGLESEDDLIILWVWLMVLARV